jgi:type IV pilus assembly protein PilP
MRLSRPILVAASCLLMGMVLAVPGCSAKKNEPSRNVASASKGVKPQLQKMSSLGSTDSFKGNYDFTAKKDPFRSYGVATKAKFSVPQTVENLLPIQKYEVNQFKVLGIVTGLTESRALVLDPSGKSFVIREGSLIGPHNGRVRSLKQNAIEIVELDRDEHGKIRSKGVKLTLPRKE